MSSIVSPLSGVFEDLMGCEEGEAECIRDARKYAAWTMYGSLILAGIYVAFKLYKAFK